jgi:hypothetical protein
VKQGQLYIYRTLEAINHVKVSTCVGVAIKTHCAKIGEKCAKKGTGKCVTKVAKVAMMTNRICRKAKEKVIYT